MINLMDASERAQLTEDLRSCEPTQVADALKTLDQAWRQRRFGPLPMPEPDCLDAFNGVVPVEILHCYLTVLMNYPDFEPTIGYDKLREALVEAVVRFGHGEETLTVALDLMTDEFPESAVSNAMRYLLHRGLDGPHEILAAQRLVDYLLDSNKTRQAVIDTLRFWTMVGKFSEVIAAVMPRLDEVELRRLDVDCED